MTTIRSYYCDGEAKDHEWIIAHRAELEDGMRQDMRDHGWIPVLDQDIKITWDYAADRRLFTYRMEAKGQRVGKKKAKGVVGLLSKEGLIVKDEGVALAA
jgi:hypothetical protein